MHRKSSVQLQREIDEALSRPRQSSLGHSTARAMTPQRAAEIVRRIAELDTEYGWRPESRADIRSKLEHWRREADGAAAAGLADTWFRELAAALAALGAQAEVVYRQRVNELNA